MKKTTFGKLALLALLAIPFAADPAVNLSSGAALLFANFLPILLLWLVLLGMGRRWVWASLLCASLLSLMYATSATKLIHLGEPLLFADFLLAAQIVSGWEMMSGYVSLTMTLALLVCLGVGLVVFWLERPLPFRVSLPCLAVGLAGFYLLSTSSLVSENLYGSRAFGSSPWQTQSFSQHQGLAASLITQSRGTQLQLPPVDEAAIASFLEQHPPLSAAAGSQPDVILWLAESFFDPDIVAGVEPCQMLPRWCELRKKGIAGNITVPTFGGNTTRTEFEVLTGVPIRVLRALDFPYTSVVTRPHTSIAQALKHQGYQTLAVHPHHKNFWRREFALPLLGFDAFLSLESFQGARSDSYWIADAEVGEKVRDLLRQPEQDQPRFVFVISMEGHGPWGRRKDLSDQALADLPITPALRGPGARQWREYLYHARNAVAEMHSMHRFIQQRERPTLLVVFGDHLPGLTDAFAQLAFRDGRHAFQQLTPVLALANYPLQSPWQPQHAHDLGVWTLELAGQTDFPGFAELAHAYRLRQQQPATAEVEEVLDALKIRQLHIQDFGE